MFLLKPQIKKKKKNEEYILMGNLVDGCFNFQEVIISRTCPRIDFPRKKNGIRHASRQ